jgi:hypothetical protein
MLQAETRRVSSTARDGAVGPTRIVPPAFALLYALCALALILPTGIAVTEDGVNMVAAARNLLAGEGFTSYGGGVFTYWPPLYVVSMTLGAPFGLDPMETAVVVNVLSAFALMWMLSAIALQLVERLSLRIFVHVALFAALPFMEVVAEVRTEPLFLALTFASMIYCARYLEEPRTRLLIVGGLLLALSCIARYQGIFLIPIWCLAILWQHRARPIAALAIAAAFGAAVVVPMLAWLIRNYLLASSLVYFGPQGTFAERLEDLFLRGFEEISTWFLPLRIDESLRIAAAAAIIIAVFGAAAIVIRRIAGEPESRRRVDLALVLLGYGLCYLAATYLVTAINGAWGIHRYLYTLYPIVFILLAFVVDRYDALAGRPGRPPGRALRAAAGVGIAALLLWLAMPLDRAVYYGGGILEGKADYFHVPRYAESEVAPWLADNRLDGALFSNEPAFVYIRSGQPARYTVTRQEFDAIVRLPRPEAADALFEFYTRENRLLSYPDGPVYLVWLHVNPREDRIRPEVLAEHLELSVHAEFDDATIYRIAR